MNDLTISQISTILNSIVAQATGQSGMEVTDTSSFVAVANTALKTGYDPIMKAISQVITKTIFSNRPYTRKFQSLEVTNQAYGNHIRKLQMADSNFEDDQRYVLEDGISIDQYKVKKPAVIQTNFYGQTTYQYQAPTIFKDQIDTAFSGPEEFGQFMAMQATNTADQIEKAHEETSRATVCNIIAGKVAGDGRSVIHVLTEYNAYLGLTGDDALTKTTIMKPENFIPFVKWLYARIKTLIGLMGERSKRFHISPNGVNLERHTPINMMNFYMYAPIENLIDASVLADTFHDNRLKLMGHESVNFWQSMGTDSDTDKIHVTAGYIDETGTAVSKEENLDGVLGVIFDKEAAGYTTVNAWSSPTPFNANGGYTNIFYHFTDKHWNDFTENAIVLLLD